MSRKHYKTKNYIYSGARKKYAHVVPAATMSTVNTVSAMSTKLSADEQFERVAAADTADVVTPAVTEEKPAVVAPSVRPQLAVVNPAPVTKSLENPQTPEQETEPDPVPVSEEPAAILSVNRSGNRTKWILLAAGVLVLFLLLRKK